MLNLENLCEFIEYMKSGQLEREFKCANSLQKTELLELLEKTMDAGEIADEVATRLIYRGLPFTPQGSPE